MTVRSVHRTGSLMSTPSNLPYLALAGLIFLLLSVSVNADTVTWRAVGKITSVDTSGGYITEFPTATIDTPFALTFVFDAASPLSSSTSGATGMRYRYQDALVSSNLTIGGDSLGRNNDGFTSIDIWDDFAFFGTTNPASDGFNLIWGVQSSEPGGFAQVGLILRGPEHLDIYSGPGLPTEPSPLLTTLMTTQLQFIDQTDSIIGIVESVTLVPIPAGFYLFGSALGLLGWARRKKA